MSNIQKPHRNEGKDGSNRSTTFDNHCKSRNEKSFVVATIYAPTLFRNLQKWPLTCKEHGTLHFLVFCIIIWQPFFQKAPTIHYLGMHWVALWALEPSPVPRHFTMHWVALWALGTITSTQTFYNLYTCNTLVVLEHNKTFRQKRTHFYFIGWCSLFKTIPVVWHLVWYEWFSTKFLPISGLLWSPTRCKIQHKIWRNSWIKSLLSKTTEPHRWYNG